MEKYLDIRPFFEGLAVVQGTNRKHGVINRAGTEIVPPIYDNIHYFKEGVAVVWHNGFYGLLSKEGVLLTPIKYSVMSSIEEGFIRCAENGKYGFLNKQGKEVIPLIYEHVIDFYEGEANVIRFADNEEGIEKGSIDREGRFTLKPTERDRAFSKEKAWRWINNARNL